MKIALFAVGILIGIVVVVFMIGLFVPRFHKKHQSRELELSPQMVWEKVSDFSQYPEWQSWTVKAEQINDETALGSLWRFTFTEHGGDVLTLEVTAWEPPRRLVTTIADDDLPFGGSWTFEISPSSVGCRVEITERGEIPNPLIRTMWLLFRPATSRAQQFIEAL